MARAIGKIEVGVMSVGTIIRERRYVINDEVIRIHRCIMCHEEVAHPWEMDETTPMRHRFHEKCRERYLTGQDTWRDIKAGHITSEA